MYKAFVRDCEPSGLGQEFAVDRELKNADPDEYDALLLPGGQINPDSLRMDEQAVAFVRAFVESGKPISAIRHGLHSSAGRAH
jgi:putative intracellular protease/amidase